jgi:NO-binding membrane sensor protein with MHYT domain
LRSEQGLIENMTRLVDLTRHHWFRGTAMQGTYSLTLVTLSLMIAMLASYTVLDLTAFISFLERPRIKHAWLAGGALAMGIGIWSMHFVGMLAFSLPIPMGYDLRITAASLVLAIFISYFALTVVISPQLTRPRLMIGGVLMGCGIAGMHYMGMAAMQMAPGIDYKTSMVVDSIGIAIVASTAALWLANALSAPSRRHVLIKRVVAAAVMGIAITGMHYTGMAAANFLPGAVCGAAKGVNPQWLATTVVMFTLGTLIAALVLSRFDARTSFLRRMTVTLEEQIKRRTGELHGALDHHQQTTQALHASRQQLEHELAERKLVQARLEKENEAQRRLIDELQSHRQAN